MNLDRKMYAVPIRYRTTFMGITVAVTLIAGGLWLAPTSEPGRGPMEDRNADQAAIDPSELDAADRAMVEQPNHLRLASPEAVREAMTSSVGEIRAPEVPTTKEAQIGQMVNTIEDLNQEEQEETASPPNPAETKVEIAELAGITEEPAKHSDFDEDAELFARLSIPDLKQDIAAMLIKDERAVLLVSTSEGVFVSTPGTIGSSLSNLNYVPLEELVFPISQLQIDWTDLQLNPTRPAIRASLYDRYGPVEIISTKLVFSTTMAGRILNAQKEALQEIEKVNGPAPSISSLRLLGCFGLRAEKFEIFSARLNGKNVLSRHGRTGCMNS